jgi:NAD(P)-dependent dehydrogenase (short-subunit alcohol dehydrogenase family)
LELEKFGEKKEMDRECALVTGATSGIGWATACALAKRGSTAGYYFAN